MTSRLVNNRRTFLIDCDGVLADFVGSVLEQAHERSSLRWTREDLKDWDIFQFLKDPLKPHLVNDIRKAIDRRGFCSNIKPLPGARAAVESLRAEFNVVCVTAPWKESRTWCHERYNWLDDHFGFRHDEVIMTSDKTLIGGHILLDDKLENLTDWTSYNLGRVALLWTTPHNLGLTAPNVDRVYSWDEIVE